MDLPELSKLRRLSLTVAVILVAILIANVQLEVPLKISPLGVPLVIGRPDLLTIALFVMAVYSTLRYIYYGMLVQPSPMRARRELINRVERRFLSGSDVMDEFREKVQRDVERLFPRIGKTQIVYEIMQDATGTHVKNMTVPRIVRLVCWVEDLDFILPVLANVVALGLWSWTFVRAS